MSTVFTGTIFHSLKETLEEIIDDDGDGYMQEIACKQWCDEKTMSDHFEEDQEMGGPAFASETDEGAQIQVGTLTEGATTRYLARKFALKLAVTEEAIEDTKYDRVISAAKRLVRSLWRTLDLDNTFMLVRATNTSYPYGDGLPLASASHTLPQGGTFSNTMATPMSPSRAAVITATTAMRTLPDHTGVRLGYRPKMVIAPVDQWAVWDGLIGSEKAPEPGEFNEINVVNRMKLDICTPVLWSNTTTNYAFRTNADEGPNYRWKRRPRNKSWVDNDNQKMLYSVDGRWSRGNSDPGRSIYFVNA